VSCGFDGCYGNDVRPKRLIGKLAGFEYIEPKKVRVLVNTWKSQNDTDDTNAAPSVEWAIIRIVKSKFDPDGRTQIGCSFRYSVISHVDALS